MFLFLRLLLLYLVDFMTPKQHAFFQSRYVVPQPFHKTCVATILRGFFQIRYGVVEIALCLLKFLLGIFQRVYFRIETGLVRRNFFLHLHGGVHKQIHVVCFLLGLFGVFARKVPV